MKLIIVESPSKTKTIMGILGEDYICDASKGHIRDIANTGKDRLGLDEKNHYKPIYEVLPHQSSTIKKLNSLISKVDEVYLATDPDREGEAISWHLFESLNLKDKTVYRVTFNEITESAIKEGMANKRDIDMNLVYAQETRKIIDKIIGYKISGLLKMKVGALEQDTIVSAGRVQSTVLSILAEKESQIKSFIPVKYFEIEAKTNAYSMKLYSNEKSEVWQFSNEEDAKNVFSKLGKDFIVSDINISDKKSYTQPPFTTSTLMQAASTKYGMTTSVLMKVAQELYEGVNINNKHVGLITYMRTDSTRLSDEFMGKLRNYILTNYGKEYLGYAHNQKKTENVQDAHEAIRPTHLSYSPETIKVYLSPQQYKVYSLIYNRAVASMMSDSISEVKKVSFNNNGYKFETSFESIKFDGYKKVAGFDKKAIVEFNNVIGDAISTNKIEILSKETEGPHHYTEASLVKAMQDLGIGRPSTYASTIKTLKDRKFVEVEKKSLVPTEYGLQVNEYLQSKFDEFFSVQYTANMENDLDLISNGEKHEEEEVESFYDSFINHFDKVKVDQWTVSTGEKCPQCGSDLIVKKSRYGRFTACSNYPQCNYIKPKEKVEIPFILCPTCGVGHLVEKKGKGKTFYGCSEYSTSGCTYTTNYLPKINKIEKKEN